MVDKPSKRVVGSALGSSLLTNADRGESAEKPAHNEELASNHEGGWEDVQSEPYRGDADSRYLIDRSHMVEDEPFVMQGNTRKTGTRRRPMVPDLCGEADEVGKIDVIRNRMGCCGQRHLREKCECQVDDTNRQRHSSRPHGGARHPVAGRILWRCTGSPPDHEGAGKYHGDRIDGVEPSCADGCSRAEGEDLQRLSEWPVESDGHEQSVASSSQEAERCSREQHETNLVANESRDVSCADACDDPDHQHHREDEDQGCEPATRHRGSIAQSLTHLFERAAQVVAALRFPRGRRSSTATAAQATAAPPPRSTMAAMSRWPGCRPAASRSSTTVTAAATVSTSVILR